MPTPDETPAPHPAPETWRRGFWSLIVTQAQNAFNDNAFKNLVIFLIIGMGFSQAQRDQLVLVVGALFSIPFILFSMAGGYFADRYSKRSVTITVKVWEIAAMLVAFTGLMVNSLPVMLAAVFLMSTQSAVFGPSKYGLLPELLPQKRLSWGNGVLELGTFLAVIGGIIAGPLMSQTFRGHQQYSGAILAGLAICGLLTSLGITRVPAADPQRKFRPNFVGDLIAEVREIRKDRVLFLAVMANTYFFFLAALLQFNIVFYGTDILKVGEVQNGYLMAGVALGIGFGSLAAGYLSGGKIEYGLVPLGSIGITVLGIMLAQSHLTFNQVWVRLAILGFFSGFFIVPVNAIIQHRPPEERKGGVIASANLLSFVAVFGASAVYFLLTTVAHFSPTTTFLATALLTVAATVYTLYLLPDALMRLLLWLATHTIYRIKVEGRDNIPERGGALFVCNHLSFVDALLLMASTDRFIRFVMFQGIYDHPIVKPWAKIMRAIPISSQLRPRDMIHSLREASQAIRDGEVVGIFAEGQITRIGQMLPFRRGFERVMKNVDAPIIPVHLDGVWGSIFSFEKGRFIWKVPRQIPYPVTVSFGKPLPSTATAFEVRQAVQELHTQAYRHRKQRMKPLHRALIHGARRHPGRFAMADAMTPKVSFGSALTKTIYLARRLRKAWQGQKMVGILLPPSVGGALVNFAAVMMGKVPVNLNYTASDESLASCARQCELKTVLTSKLFMERVKITPPGEVLYIDEIAAEPRASEKLIALLMTWLLPARALEKALGREQKASLDDLATIIFSSGSTGDPKGVMLSHFNIGSNIEQLGQVFVLGRKDRVLGVLPFFHSFGFMGTLWLPAVLGVGAVYHPSPLDAAAIGDLVDRYRVTFLLVTPTFLQAYMRRAAPEQFGSLQYVLVGAEKLSERVAQAFEDKYGIRPLEAYGCTECAPAVTVNTRDYRAPGFRQVGGKRGKIGHPLPGISARIVDPETLQPLPLGAAGLLLVRGPNIMQGYLGKPEKTAEVLRDGWYTTGDIAALDEDGFLTITDRLSRFSKIGGEMVPHIRIEDKLHELAGITEQTFAVTGLPDEKKGERLVVLHTLPDDKIKDVQDKLAASELPALWKPRAGQFYRVEKLPYLGTGKMDLRRIREQAAELAASAVASG